MSYYKHEGAHSWCVYILYLENEKWYVGLTHDVYRRFEEHLNGCGAHWTKIYKPIEIIHIWQTACYKKAKAEDIEDKTTIEMMRVFGKENVRGGRFVSIDQNEVDEMLGEELSCELDNTYNRRGKKYFDLVKPNLSINKFDEINRQEKKKVLSSNAGAINRVNYRVTPDKKEIHVKFPSRPSYPIRKKMIENGWDYKAYAQYWSKGFNKENLDFAKELCGEASDVSHEEDVQMRFKVRQTEILEYILEAENEEQAREFMDNHTIRELRSKNPGLEVLYADNIVGKTVMPADFRSDDEIDIFPEDRNANYVQENNYEDEELPFN